MYTQNKQDWTHHFALRRNYPSCPHDLAMDVEERKTRPNPATRRSLRSSRASGSKIPSHDFCTMPNSVILFASSDSKIILHICFEKSRPIPRAYVSKDKRRMSSASKFTLAATALGTAGIVYFVHWSQDRERAVRPFIPDLYSSPHWLISSRRCTKA